MVQAATQSITLEEFLKRPETKPASEYIEGKVIQKVMPKTRHSRLQSKIIEAINTVSEREKIAYAFPEIRCTFGARSIVPDIGVFWWENIRFNEDGEPLDNIIIPPDWTIEILSPGQSSHPVIGKILHSMKYGCQLGWLIDPDERSILLFQPKQEPILCYGDDRLIVLRKIKLELTAERLFNWLKMTE